MKITKSKIDRAGISLSKDNFRDAEDMIDLEHVFDEYRKSHLEPLSETTLELQSWLNECGYDYHIAQRLKRKPQIIRKLNRLSVRLTQLQDIGGCRIIVENNEAVEQVINFLENKIKETAELKLSKITDYRKKGRDITGYRAVHLLLERDGRKLELQIRSRIQHYWAESIERASVIYGHHLKEGEGDPIVISYFQKLSDIFFEIESGRSPSGREKLDIDAMRNKAEEIIREKNSSVIVYNKANYDIILTLNEKERKNPGLNNWIIIFDWSTGNFVSWDIVGKTPDEAIAAYIKYENQFPAEKNFEVVLIGSSKVTTVKSTHSHYFGIEDYATILEGLDESIKGFEEIGAIDISCRKILLKLYAKHFWGKKSVTPETLRNHFCRDVKDIEKSLDKLVEKGLVLRDSAAGPVSLNVKAKSEIDRLVS